jgi:hypothetical protein
VVKIIPKSQIKTVRQTSANDLETGDIFFDTVTAIGTEIAIDMIKPIFSSTRKRFSLICSQNCEMLSR